MLISFIVPVYNVENYVRECIDSLLALLVPDFEILLVLGKSDDTSNQICLEYENKDKRTHVIYQEGKGLSDARNSGLRVARGDYIAFIDSDDYIAPEKLQHTLMYVQSMSKVDVFASDFVRVFKGGELVENRQIEPSEQMASDDASLNRFLAKTGTFWNVWRYIYKKEFLMAHQLWFKPNVFGEDVDYTIRVLLAYPKIAFFHNPYYYYRVRRPASLMNTNTLGRLTDTITIISDCADRVAQSSHPYRQSIMEHLVLEWILNMAGILELPGKDRPKAVRLFQERKNVLRLSRNPLYRLSAWCIRLFGIPPSAVCLHLAKKSRRFIKEYF